MGVVCGAAKRGSYGDRHVASSVLTVLALGGTFTVGESSVLDAPLEPVTKCVVERGPLNTWFEPLRLPYPQPEQRRTRMTRDPRRPLARTAVAVGKIAGLAITVGGANETFLDNLYAQCE